MTDTADIGELVKRLDEEQKSVQYDGLDDNLSELLHDAARALTALEAENKAMRQTLEPFRRVADAVFYIDEDGHEMNKTKADDQPVWGFNSAMIRYGDLRAARRALGGDHG